MKRSMYLSVCTILCGLVVAGCANYTWRSQVPEEMRTVAVPVFRNESNVTGLGSAVTRQVLREFEREGTFAIKPAGDAALEIQGIIVNSDAKVVAYDRQTGARNRESRFNAEAKVSVIDKRAGKVLVDNRKYQATTTFVSSNDLITGQADASGRLAEELARQIVDDVVSLNWKSKTPEAQETEVLPEVAPEMEGNQNPATAEEPVQSAVEVQTIKEEENANE